MTRFTRVPLTAIAEDTPPLERIQAYFDWCQAVQRANSHVFLPFGVKRRWHDFGKIEHPFTTKHEIVVPLLNTQGR